MNLPNFAMWQHQNLLENDENNHFSAGIKLKNPNCGPFFGIMRPLLNHGNFMGQV
jgi:hypothetical protein